MIHGVRYQVYEAADGRYVLFMASEQSLWKNFCEAVDRTDLFERWPGSKYADHAVGNLELRAELRDIFRTRTSTEWIDYGVERNFPVAPVNSPKTIAEDPQFQDRFHVVLRRPARRRAAGLPAQVHRRADAGPGARPDGRPAHRGGPRRRAGMGRRQDRGVTGQGRPRRTVEPAIGRTGATAPDGVSDAPLGFRP